MIEVTGKTCSDFVKSFGDRYVSREVLTEYNKRMKGKEDFSLAHDFRGYSLWRGMGWFMR